MAKIGFLITAVGMACSMAVLARTTFPRIAPERYLLERGLWCECSGEPMNKWAEEYDRRDAEKEAP